MPAPALPARNLLNHRHLLENLPQHPPVHVLTHRQPKHRQHRRTHIQQRRPTHPPTTPDPRPVRQKYPVRPMLMRWPRRLHRQLLRPQMVRMKPVVRHQQHRHILPSQMQQHPQHHVVKPIPSLNHPTVPLEILLTNPFLPRRMVLHESMTKMINRIKIHPHEIPRLLPQQKRRRSLHVPAIRNNLRQRLQPPIFPLVHLRSLRHKRQQMLRTHIRLMHPQRRHHLHHLRRMHRPRSHRPLLYTLPARPLIVIRHHHPIDRLRRMTRPPANHHRPLPLLRQYVPNRLARPRSPRNRPDLPSHRIRLAESMNPMLVRPLPRRNRRPQHRRIHRLQ